MSKACMGLSSSLNVPPLPHDSYQDGFLSPIAFGDPAFDPQSGFKFTDEMGGDAVTQDVEMDSALSEGTCDAPSSIDLAIACGVYPSQDDGLFSVSSGTQSMSSGTHSMSSGTHSISSGTHSMNLPMASHAGAQGCHSNRAARHTLPKPNILGKIDGSHSASADWVHDPLAPKPSGNAGDIKRQVRDDSKAMVVVQSTPEKSERARKAAVQWHAKAKKSRQSSEDSGSRNTEEDLAEDQKGRNREKNKIAAAKCRAKKRGNVEVIESSHRTLCAENTYLRRREQQLREAVAQLRTLALDHQGCQCGVHQYNIHEARRMALGLGSIHSPVESVTAGSLTHPAWIDGEGRKSSDSSGETLSPTFDAPRDQVLSFAGSRPTLWDA